MASVVVIAVASSGGAWLQAGPLYPWKAAACFAASMTIAIGFIGGHPFPQFGPANCVTTVRLMLVALAAGLIGEPAVPRVAAAAVSLIVTIAVLDGFDGWLARRSRMTSDFGARFDMETDALLILVVSVLVWRHGKAGAWVLLGGLMRYAFVAAGWPWPWMAGRLTPTWRAKVITVAHITGLVVALSPVVSTPVSGIAAATTLAALTWSFAIDVGRLWRNA